MLRPILALAAAASIAAPAAASTYAASPVKPAEGRIIGRNIVWACGPAACVGSTKDSRPLVICQDLAKRAGAIESFIADGRAFSRADLDRCNARAKAPPAQGLADR